MGAGAMTLSAAAFFLVPGPLARFYSDDPAVVALVVSVLPVAAVFQLFDGTQGVSFGVFRGLDDLRVPALFNVVGYWLVGLPLAAWLVFGLGLGLPGLWAGYSVALGIVAGLLVTRLALRTWAAPAVAAEAPAEG
jgi:MATE family multidrug resistance protein